MDLRNPKFWLVGFILAFVASALLPPLAGAIWTDFLALLEVVDAVTDPP